MVAHLRIGNFELKSTGVAFSEAMMVLAAYRPLLLLIIGRGIKALVPLAIVLIYTHKGQLSEVGEFGFAQSLALPAVLLFGLNLRRLIATDIAHTIWPREAFLLRFSGLALMLLVFLCVRGSLGLSGLTFIILGLRSIEAFRDLNYGFFQLHDRQAFIATSQLIEGGVSLAGIWFIAWLGFPLLHACIWLVITTSLSLIFIEYVLLKRLGLHREYKVADAMGRENLIRISILATLPTVLCTLVGFIPNLVVKTTQPAIALGTFVLIRTLIVPFDFVFEIFRTYSLTTEARNDANRTSDSSQQNWRSVYFLCATFAFGIIVLLVATLDLIISGQIAETISQNRITAIGCALAVYLRILVGFYQNILFIRKMFRWQAILESISPLLMLLAMLPLAAKWGLPGVAIGLAANAGIDLFLVKYVLSREKK